MKRIIAFVFLGILIYAGIFTIIYGVREYNVSVCNPITLENTLRSGLVITDSISEQYGVLGKKINQNTLFGIPIGKETATYFYIVSYGDSPKFFLIGVTDPEDIEAIENASPGNEFNFTGVLQSMDPVVSVRLREFLADNPGLVGHPTAVYSTEAIAAAHVTEYAVYVRDIKGPDAVPIIVGAAMLLVGGGLAALLIVRIVSERTGY